LQRRAAVPSRRAVRRPAAARPDQAIGAPTHLTDEGWPLMRTRAATYLRFLAVFAVLGTLGLASSAYLLIKQRAPNPFRDTYTIKAMFTEADGVIAGIGQPVNVAGVKVGQVTGARLADGKALVTMELRREQLPHVYADASAILDPITPLKDMQIALSPGRPQPSSTTAYAVARGGRGAARRDPR